MPDRIRTYDLLLRKQTLYPAELRAHVDIVANIHLEIKWASSTKIHDTLIIPQNSSKIQSKIPLFSVLYLAYV